MSSDDRRRSVRHQLIETSVEVHLGPQTGTGLVIDISQHGMGLVLPSHMSAETGALLWMLVDRIAPYAITATVCRVGADGEVGVEFEEILQGDALEKIEALPISTTEFAQESAS